jgi:hypothetical protein
MAIDISGIYFFMPVFSFLFVFVLVYALLAKTKVLGEGKFVHLLISFVIAAIFMTFSSLELYVRTIIPWFVVLLVVILLILMIAGLSTKKLDDIMSKQMAWAFIVILIIIFLIAAIKVFNPVLHPDLVITGGENGPGIISQIYGLFGSSGNFFGSLLLIVLVAIVAWVITKK